MVGAGPSLFLHFDRGRRDAFWMSDEKHAGPAFGPWASKLTVAVHRNASGGLAVRLCPGCERRDFPFALPAEPLHIGFAVHDPGTAVIGAMTKAAAAGAASAAAEVPESCTAAVLPPLPPRLPPARPASAVPAPRLRMCPPLIPKALPGCGPPNASRAATGTPPPRGSTPPLPALRRLLFTTTMYVDDGRDRRHASGLKQRYLRMAIDSWRGFCAAGLILTLSIATTVAAHTGAELAGLERTPCNGGAGEPRNLTVLLRRYPVSIRAALMRLWQVTWAERAAQHDWFLHLEDDVIADWRVLSRLIQDYARLRGTGLVPSLVRYGVGRDGRKYMTQAGCCCNRYPCECDCSFPVRMLWRAAGETWWEPGSGQYGAYTFASAAELAQLLDATPFVFGSVRLSRRAVRFAEIAPGAWGLAPRRGPRCLIGGHWRTGGDLAEEMTQAWPWGCPARVVPAARPEDYLVHHASNKYATPPVVGSWAPVQAGALAECLGEYADGRPQYPWRWKPDGSVDHPAFPPAERKVPNKSGRGVLGFAGSDYRSNFTWMRWPSADPPPCQAAPSTPGPPPAAASPQL
eukprot:TRINITY_DN7354_c0_g1_i4.p2 TRINITY_DN7354_c0_g1~~TRINITY_DN7354_c0_g1_i4.p2  ORF type:complete len:574 (+),score=100.61 TRINITY_DN7354_c0_g1_i4:579-2300(+)